MRTYLPADEAAAGLVGQPPIREVVPRAPGASVRWHVHDYPGPWARWNYHPEYELHLITRTHGRFLIGDTIGPFSPGQLVLVGPNLPHHWISDIEDGEPIEGRDVVLHFHDDWISRGIGAIPELSDVEPLLRRARHGIEFRGATAVGGAQGLRRIGELAGLDRVLAVLRLLAFLAAAPRGDFRLLVGAWRPQPHHTGAMSDGLARAVDYVFENVGGNVRLSVAARLAGMSEASFSRYFQMACGLTFTDMVRKLRLTQAARLLQHSSTPIAEIVTRVGYSNQSNFNRQFLGAYGMTPRRYRAAAQTAATLAQV